MNYIETKQKLNEGLIILNSFICIFYSNKSLFLWYSTRTFLHQSLIQIKTVCIFLIEFNSVNYLL